MFHAYCKLQVCILRIDESWWCQINYILRSIGLQDIPCAATKKVFNDIRRKYFSRSCFETIRCIINWKIKKVNMNYFVWWYEYISSYWREKRMTDWIDGQYHLECQSKNCITVSCSMMINQIKFDPFTHSSYLLINGLSSATSWYEWFEEASDDSFSLFFLLVSLLSSLSLLSSSSFVLTLYRPSIFKMMTSRTVKERESNVHHSTPTILIPIQIINPSMLDNDWWYYLEH